MTNPSSVETMIQAEGLTKLYGSFIAAEDVSFTINRGEVAAFLGPNGAGKSTTMKMLTGILAPDHGTSTIAGFSSQQSPLDLSHQLGYLPESGPLYEDMTPAESLSFFADARGLRGKEKQERIQAVKKRLELAEVFDKPIDKLSQGYRQRVGLAQALLHDPKVLIMDEPTLGLDPNQIKTFRNHIRDLAGTKTILISTHILQEVEAVADRIILINEGRIAFDGSPDELKKGESIENAFYRLTDSAHYSKERR
ncbi:MAG: ABC transporter ATP-binding protein [Fibrobacterota bacterium]